MELKYRGILKFFGKKSNGKRIPLHGREEIKQKFKKPTLIRSNILTHSLYTNQDPSIGMRSTSKSEGT
jgi:hypothetical protein